jgi:hypothetical protein
MERRRIAFIGPTGALVLALVIAACSSGTAGSPSSSPSVPSAGSPGSSPSADPSPSDPGAGNVPDPDGSLVFPVPGVIDPQPVTVETVSATIEDGHVVVRLEWVSGVEPCHSLAGVNVARDGDTFTLTVFEGPTDLDAMCIEIAMFKATLVDLGELPAGEYTIQTDPAGAAPLTVTVP